LRSACAFTFIVPFNHSFAVSSYACIRRLVDMLRGDEPVGVPGSQLDLARQACVLAYRLLQLQKPEGSGCVGVEEEGGEGVGAADEGEEAVKEGGVVGEEVNAGASDEGEEANEDLQTCARTLFVSIDAYILCVDDPPPICSVVRRSHKKKQLTEACEAPAAKRTCTTVTRTRTNGGRQERAALATAASKRTRM
jgi:hypothetical protein